MRWISRSLIVALAFFATNCGKIDPTMLEGTWLATRTEMKSEGEFGNSETNTKLPESQGFYYKFERGQMTVPVANSTQVSYQASYKLDGNSLRLLSDRGEQIEFEILSLSEDELVLRREIKEGERSAHTDIIFKRISTGPAPMNQAPMNQPTANQPSAYYPKGS